MIQSRSESTGIAIHTTLQKALQFAQDDPTIWKISFEIEDGTRLRLVRTTKGWMYEDLMSDWAEDIKIE